jgi:hypothetical protein
MQKLLTGLAASAAFALFVSAAQADCGGHEQVTADNMSMPEETVVVGTHDAAPTAPATTVECAPDAKDCVPAQE